MRLLRALVPAVLLLLPACTGIEARADFDPEVDFGAYETFAMAPPPAEAPEGLPGYSEVEGRQANREIAAQLQARGLREVDEAEAELVVGFELHGEPRSEVRSRPGSSVGLSRGWYSAGWYDRDVYTVHYVLGTMIIDMFDREKGKLVWHGWSSVSIHSESPRKGRREEVIAKILEGYPEPLVTP